MVIRVKLFARARDLVGAGELSVSLSKGATVGELRRVVSREYPALRGLLTTSAIAIGNDFAGDSLYIVEGVEVALLPPVSGG
jgi:molybdopterin converting factor subunit 1